MKRIPARTRAPLPMPRFADRLQDGERLLWEGRPDPRLLIRPHAVMATLLFLPFLPVIVLLEQWHSPGTFPVSSPLTWIIGAGGLLVGCWAYAKEIKVQAQTAAYALTDRRVFVRRLERLTARDWRPRVDEFSLKTVRPGLRPTGGGRGIVTLGSPFWQYTKSLQDIPNAEVVFALLSQQRSALSEQNATASEEARPYYQAPPQATVDSVAAPAFSLVGCLRRGETVLWEGGQDPAHLWRAQIWEVIGMILFVSSWLSAVLFLNHWWTPLRQVLIVAAVATAAYPLARYGYAQTAANRRYALTNRRVLVIKKINGPTPQVDEREMPSTRNMRMVRGQDGFGTIIFEKKTRFVWHGQGGTVETYEFSFKHIADAEAVYGLIQAAQFGYSAQPA